MALGSGSSPPKKAYSALLSTHHRTAVDVQPLQVRTLLHRFVTTFSLGPAAFAFRAFTLRSLGMKACAAEHRDHQALSFRDEVANC